MLAPSLGYIVLKGGYCTILVTAGHIAISASWHGTWNGWHFNDSSGFLRFGFKSNLEKANLYWTGLSFISCFIHIKNMLLPRFHVKPRFHISPVCILGLNNCFQILSNAGHKCIGVNAIRVFRKQIKWFVFLSFHNPKMAQVVKCKNELTYPTCSTPRISTTWRLKGLNHDQSWIWLRLIWNA